MKYEANKGQRIKNRKFLWAQIISIPEDANYMVIHFDDGSREWVESSKTWNEKGRLNPIINGKSVNHGDSGFGPIHSVRAFRRRLKQWSNILPKDTELQLVSRYIGHCVKAKIY